MNSFKLTQADSVGDESLDTQRNELISKLEQPGSAYQKNRTFTVTPNGVFLRKGEEVGMFQMGSTIVMMFECPKETSVLVQEGEKLKMGQRITANTAL